MRCLYCGRPLPRGARVCSECRSNGDGFGKAVPGLNTPPSALYAPLPPMNEGRVDPWRAVLAGTLFGGVILAIILSNTFYFAAFGKAARTGSESSGAWLDLTIGRRFTFSGVVFDVGPAVGRPEAAGIGRELYLVRAEDLSKVRAHYSTFNQLPKKIARRYVTRVTPLTNEPALKGEDAERLRFRAIKLVGFLARVDTGRLGSEPLEFRGGDSTLIYVSALQMGEVVQ